MSYVDGFVLPVPTENLATYKKMAQAAGKIWIEYGALEYRECMVDDMNESFGMPFSKGVKLKAGETVFFSYIVFKSRAHRDKVNAKVMKDPRLMAMCDPKKSPFDVKRMMYAGFKPIVDLSQRKK